MLTTGITEAFRYIVTGRLRSDENTINKIFQSRRFYNLQIKKKKERNKHKNKFHDNKKGQKK